MKQILPLLLLMSLQFCATAQSKIQLLVAGGGTFTPDIKYNNSTGHIKPAFSGSLAGLYHPLPIFEIELKLSVLMPVSYLSNDTTDVVKVYTNSHIVLQRLSTGFNFCLPLTKVQPFAGIMAGAAFAQTTDIEPQSSIITFTWGFQAGARVPISKLLGLRLDASEVFIPGVANNTSYFNTDANGGGFPSFVIGDASKATIKQWNVNLGLLVNLGKIK